MTKETYQKACEHGTRAGVDHRGRPYSVVVMDTCIIVTTHIDETKIRVERYFADGREAVEYFYSM